MIEQVNRHTKRYSLFNRGIVLAISKNNIGITIMSLYSKWTHWEIAVMRPVGVGRGENLADHLPPSMK